MTQLDHPIALKVEHLRKSFGGAVALDDFSLEVKGGEIHALLGQNGCGKSTFVKSLTGVVEPDEGSVSLFGRKLSLPVFSPSAQGIAVIHQDIGIVGSMTVLENLGVVANYGSRALSPIDLRRERATYQVLMDQLGISLDLEAYASTLSSAEQTFLGVVRAMRIAGNSSSRQLFILDEPTASLSKPEAGKVLKLMRRIADLGAGVVFISHRISEVFEVCDKVTVMRTGRDIAHRRTADISREELLTLMLGKRLDDMFPSPPKRNVEAVRLSTRRLSGRVLRDANIDIHAGEIVGVAGLAGMGQEELPYLLSGAADLSGGEFLLDGEKMSFRSPADSIKAGIVLVPRNRLRDGIWSSGSAEENLTLPVLAKHFSKGFLNRPALRRQTMQGFANLSVYPDRPDYAMSAFSGGNQQKIVFAKWLQLNPKVLLLEEPTQGVDPGAAKQLLDHAVASADSGAAVLILSGDFELLSAVCHRILIVQNGNVVSELAHAELSEEAIMHACDAVQPDLNRDSNIPAMNQHS